MRGPRPSDTATPPDHPAPPPAPAGRCGGRIGAPMAAAGFTLLEMMIVSVILGTLAALAIPRLNDAILMAQVAKATADIKTIEIELYDYWSDQGELPTSLAAIGREAFPDPWGRPYAYVAIAVSGTGPRIGDLRKDRFLVPLNSDFDLFSTGRDGRSQGPLSAATSQDDVVRANDGGFVGLASEY